jgi:hypothetical protein
MIGSEVLRILDHGTSLPDLVPLPVEKAAHRIAHSADLHFGTVRCAVFQVLPHATLHLHPDDRAFQLLWGQRSSEREGVLVMAGRALRAVSSRPPVRVRLVQRATERPRQGAMPSRGGFASYQPPCCAVRSSWIVHPEVGRAQPFRRKNIRRPKDLKPALRQTRPFPRPKLWILQALGLLQDDVPLCGRNARRITESVICAPRREPNARPLDQAGGGIIARTPLRRAERSVGPPGRARSPRSSR